MRTMIHYVLLSAFRDRLFLGMLAAMLATSGISGVLAATSMVEVTEMTLAFSGAAARLILMLGVIVFITFHVRQSFDNKEIDVILSRPISRPMLVLSYWIAFSLVAAMMALLSAAVIFYIGPLNSIGFAGWTASLILEALLVVACSLFASLILKSAVISVLTSMGFYVLARMMGFFLATVQSRSLFDSPELTLYARKVMEGLAILIPRLDFFAKTRWLVYGFEHLTQESLLFIAQAAVFIPLLLTAAILDFRRRQF